MQKVCYLDRNLAGKYWPYCLKPENTGHIILNWKILAILCQIEKYWASVRIKLALDITISEFNLVKKVFQISNLNKYITFQQMPDTLLANSLTV